LSQPNPQEETDTGPDHLQAECPKKCNTFIYIVAFSKLTDWLYREKVNGLYINV
jgi:hypothetical protein